MARKKKKQQQRARNVRRNLRAKVNEAVAKAFPNCVAEFCGGVEKSRMATRGQTLGFRIKDSRGKYHSNIIWVNPEYEGGVCAAWIRSAVNNSNG